MCTPDRLSRHETEIHCFHYSSKGKPAPSCAGIAGGWYTAGRGEESLGKWRKEGELWVFGRQIHKCPDIKEREKRPFVPVHFPVDSVELTPSEQSCKNSKTSLGSPDSCNIWTFPHAVHYSQLSGVKSRFWSQVVLVRILPLIALGLAFEMSRSILTEFPVLQHAHLQHWCNVLCSQPSLMTSLSILWCVTMPASLNEPRVYTCCIFLIFWDLKRALFLL